MNKDLYSFFLERTAKFPGRLAIQMRPRYRLLRWTYADLERWTKALSGKLAAAGLAKGDRVLLYSANSPHWIAAFFAVLSRGGIVVPLNSQAPSEQLERIVASAKPTLLLKSSRLPWTLGGPRILILDQEIEGLRRDPPPRAVSWDDIAEIIYTSGTTGRPKGVMLTHGNILSNLQSFAQAIDIESSDHYLGILPLFHMYAQMTTMLHPLAHGAAITFVPSVGSRVIREVLAYTPATHLIAVPEFLKKVMDRLQGDLSKRHLEGLLTARWMRRLPFGLRRILFAPIRNKISKTLHTIASGGAALDPEVENKWRVLGFHVLQGYGLTETSPGVSVNTYKVHRVGSVGKPLPGVVVRLAPDGEILIKGPNVMKGYYGDEQATAAVFRESWFKSDDGGRMDEDGFLYVFGRRKYMILGPGGENVFPEDIEMELNKIDGVKDSAVVGVPYQGRTIVHAVLLTDRTDLEAIVQGANKHLAPHQQITEWSLWAESDFPRSATRKVRKEEVLSWIHTQGKGPIKRPQSETTRLTRLLAEVTDTTPEEIHPATRIASDLKLDSLTRIELVSRIEEEFGVLLEERVIGLQTTVGQLESLIEQRKGSAVATARYSRWSIQTLPRIMRPFLQRALIFWLLPAVYKIQTKGREHLEGLEGPVLFMPNHRSYLDSLAMIHVLPHRFRKRLAIAAATTVLYARYRWFVPLAELLFNSFPFPVEADENIRPGLDFTGRLLDEGWNVLVYPEGQMNLTEKPMLPLKTGAGLLAVEMNVPVVPIAILGTALIIPAGGIWPRKRGEVEIRFGEPLKIKPTETYREATERIAKSMSRLLG